MRLIIVFILVFSFSFAQMKFANPQPSFDTPRKMVVQISSDSNDEINHILGSINNILKEYPTGTIEVAVVCYYHGLKVLRKEETKLKQRVDALKTYDVEFIACENTMQSKKWDKKDMIDGITYVQAGLAEVLERVASGWISIRP